MEDAIVNEIVYDAKGLDGTYNIISITFYILFAIFMLIIVNELLLSWNVNINSKFVIAVIPFIILGSVLRVCEDLDFIPYPYSILAVSPIVYFVITFIILVTIRILKYRGFTLHDKFKLLGDNDFNFIYIVIILSQALDGIISAIGVSIYSYEEKNLISSMFMNTTPMIFIAYKILLGVGFVYVFNNKTRVICEKPTRLEFLVLIGMVAVGLAPTLRNLLRIIIGV